jgi:hypothetical protein
MQILRLLNFAVLVARARSQFTLPYVGLANYRFALAAVRESPSHEAMPRARELARRALEIDRQSPKPRIQW